MDYFTYSINISMEFFLRFEEHGRQQNEDFNRKILTRANFIHSTTPTKSLSLVLLADLDLIINPFKLTN